MCAGILFYVPSYGIFNKGLWLQQWSEVQGCQSFSFRALQAWVVSWFGFEAVRVSWSELQGVLEGSCSFFFFFGGGGVLAFCWP